MSKKLWFQVHWFVGITAGVVLALVGVTGALLSYEDAVLDWLNRDVRRVEVRAEPPLLPSELVGRIRDAHPDKRITALTLSSDPTHAVRVTFADQRTAPGGRPGRGETRYADPWSGAVHASAGDRGTAFFRTSMQLHRWLTAGEFGNRPVGKQIVGASTALLVLLCLSGLYLRWPRHAASLKAWLTFDFSLRGRSFLWHLHSIVGTWALVAFLIMALSGLYWSYDWYRDGLYALTGTEQTQARRAAPSGPPVSGSPDARAPQAGLRAGSRETGTPRAEAPSSLAPHALDRAWTVFTSATVERGYETATVNLAGATGSALELRYLDSDAHHERASNRITIDPSRGTIASHERHEDKPAGARLMAGIFALHSGSYFGAPGVFAFMLASLSMPLFAISGWMLYLDRRRKKQAARHAEATASARAPGPLAAARSVLIAHASQTGLAQRLAWETAGALGAAGVAAEVVPLGELDTARLTSVDRALFVVSTYGEGEAPDGARGFARRMLTSNLPLKRLQYAVLAIGDARYATFCEFGRRVDSWLSAQGAARLFARVDVDSSAEATLDVWNAGVASLADCDVQAITLRTPLREWKLTGRGLANSGSAHPACYVRLEPVDAADLGWSAGDIAVIEPCGAGGRALPLREYSIATLPEEGRIELLVRQVGGHAATGTGSGWLTARAPVGSTIRLGIRSNPGFHAPPLEQPLILIGNGTGLAGLRSHLALRAAAQARGERIGPAWLIFGERHAASDAFYRADLGRWQAAGVLERVDLVYSRDGGPHIHVQDRLCAERERVREWIAAGASIYVCGSLGGMAPGVDAVLAETLGSVRLDELAASGRYRRDVY